VAEISAASKESLEGLEKLGAGNIRRSRMGRGANGEEYVVTPPGEVTGVQSNHFQSNQMKFSLGINFLSI
jgi:hypothetical protein